tara:strand:+ start:33 stop:449 length:417 start_codon:yes stop_codon:yes gene_type:complete
MNRFSSPFLAKSPLNNGEVENTTRIPLPDSHMEINTYNYARQTDHFKKNKKKTKVKQAYVSDSKSTEIDNPENITQQHTAQITNKPFINSFLQTQGGETTGQFNKNKKVRMLKGDRAINKYNRVKDRSHRRLRNTIKT